jgi:NADH-quinone oxidoreductase subunit N
MISSTDILSILPLIILMTWASALLLVGTTGPGKRPGVTAALAALGFIVTLVFAVLQAPQAADPLVTFGGMVIVDGFAVFLNVVFLVSGIFGISIAYDYLVRMGIERTEYYVLLMFSISGMMLMGVAGNLIIVFLAIELLSIPLYILSAFALPRTESEEAGIKYFLLGAFSSAFIVYGVALTFGATGTTSIPGMVEAIQVGGAFPALLVAGAAMILVGLSFKVAAVPFHMWTPDVYHGAPSSIVGFMSVGAKVGGFAGLLRVFIVAFPPIADDMVPILWGLAALTMIVGNIAAIAQANIKRMLAYSSIAHAGYILMAMVPYAQEGLAQTSVAAALFYTVAYTFTNFAAWAVVIALEQVEAGPRGINRGLLLSDYAGLARRSPGLAAAMTVAMLSFTGVPPTLGFFGKFYLFQTAVEGGFIGLALIGVLTSLISAYYYLRVVVIMYMQDGDPVVRPESLLKITAGVTAVATVALSLFAQPLFTWAEQALLLIF